MTNSDDDGGNNQGGCFTHLFNQEKNDLKKKVRDVSHKAHGCYVTLRMPTSRDKVKYTVTPLGGNAFLIQEHHRHLNDSRLQEELPLEPQRIRPLPEQIEEARAQLRLLENQQQLEEEEAQALEDVALQEAQEEQERMLLRVEHDLYERLRRIGREAEEAIEEAEAAHRFTEVTVDALRKKLDDDDDVVEDEDMVLEAHQGTYFSVLRSRQAHSPKRHSSKRHSSTQMHHSSTRRHSPRRDSKRC